MFALPQVTAGHGSAHAIEQVVNSDSEFYRETFDQCKFCRSSEPEL